MPSPFPGMDPYFEDPSVWNEFHYVFTTECLCFLSNHLPESYVANIVERVELISRDDEAAKQYVPDVVVAREIRPRAVFEQERSENDGELALAVAPITIPSADSIEVREAHVEIFRLPDLNLITSIELLSPWNKFGEGLGEYRHKRRSLVRQGVHVVEIDLLRRGRRTELARPLPAGDYYSFVFRGDRRPDVDVYAWNIRQPLPVIPIPLAAPDPDVPLELSTLVDTAYDRGRYVRKLRYAKGPPPDPLSSADAAWAVEIAGKK